MCMVIWGRSQFRWDIKWLQEKSDLQLTKLTRM